MTLTLGELSYPIERFSANINYEPDMAFSRVECTLSPTDDDPAEIGAEINQTFDGNFVISTPMKTYSYTGYWFESIDATVDNRGEVIMLRFSKE